MKSTLAMALLILSLLVCLVVNSACNTGDDDDDKDNPFGDDDQGDDDDNDSDDDDDDNDDDTTPVDDDDDTTPIDDDDDTTPIDDDDDDDDDNDDDNDDDDILVGFQYLGADGLDHELDDILITDATDTTVLEEGFEAGSFSAGWTQDVFNTGYTWFVADTSYSEAPHTGTYYARVDWDTGLNDQDEWLITPPLTGSGPYHLDFWTMGSVVYWEAATLHVHYSCNGGVNWTEIYMWMGEGGSYTWTNIQETFDCP